MTRIAGYEINNLAYKAHYDDETSALKPSISWAFSRVLQFAAGAVSRAWTAHKDRQTMRALSQLEPWQLKDIGYPERYKR